MLKQGIVEAVGEVVVALETRFEVLGVRIVDAKDQPLNTRALRLVEIDPALDIALALGRGR